MSEPRPSMTLILDIDERVAEVETKLELARCFNYLGAPLVRTHATTAEAAGSKTDTAKSAAAAANAKAASVDSDTPIVNTARMLVKMGTKKYLYSDDEGADERWKKSDLSRWFYNEFYKIGNNMKIFNRRQREIGNPEVKFDWLIVELQNGDCDVHFRLDSNSDIPAEQSAILEVVRTALNNGSLGDGRAVKEIKMPTDASWNAQVAAAVVEKQRREERRKAVEAAAAAEAEAAAAAAEVAAEEAFLESPAKVQAKKASEKAHALAEEEAFLQAHAQDTPGEQDDQNAAIQVTQEELSEEEALRRAEEEWQQKFSFPEVDFTVDYNLWDVLYDDGSACVYDMSEGAVVTN